MYLRPKQVFLSFKILEKGGSLGEISGSRNKYGRHLLAKSELHIFL